MKSWRGAVFDPGVIGILWDAVWFTSCMGAVFKLGVMGTLWCAVWFTSWRGAVFGLGVTIVTCVVNCQSMTCTMGLKMTSNPQTTDGIVFMIFKCASSSTFDVPDA